MTKKEIVEMLRLQLKVYESMAESWRKDIKRYKELHYLPSSIRIARNYLEKWEDRVKVVEALCEKARSK
jgi:hypothetical protein